MIYNPEKGAGTETPNPESRGCLPTLLTLAGYGVAFLPALLTYMSPDNNTDPGFGNKLRQYNPFIPNKK